MSKLKVVASEQVSNGGESAIETMMPYIVTVTIEGQADILFHRWNCDAVDAKSKSAKGSAAKKSDDLESYVYRNDAGQLALPGEYLRGAIVTAAKFEQDPRSPRKSAMDLVKAAIITMTPLASLGVSKWDYEDRRRVTIQRNGITRIRPALRAGWKATIDLQVQLPEYVSPVFLRRIIDNAGRLIGVGDFRPTFGRFAVTQWDLS